MNQVKTARRQRLHLLIPKQAHRRPVAIAVRPGMTQHRGRHVHAGYNRGVTFRKCDRESPDATSIIKNALRLKGRSEVRANLPKNMFNMAFATPEKLLARFRLKSLCEIGCIRQDGKVWIALRHPLPLLICTR